jgi:hypothetical protein
VVIFTEESDNVPGPRIHLTITRISEALFPPGEDAPRALSPDKDAPALSPGGEAEALSPDEVAEALSPGGEALNPGGEAQALSPGGAAPREADDV